jgi:hypothetical protein
MDSTNTTNRPTNYRRRRAVRPHDRLAREEAEAITGYEQRTPSEQNEVCAGIMEDAQKEEYQAIRHGTWEFLRRAKPKWRAVFSDPLTRHIVERAKKARKEPK